MAEPTIVQGPRESRRGVRIDPDTATSHYTRTDLTWTPRTFADELSERDDEPAVRVRCDCGRVRPAYAVIDARSLPDAITGGQEWACDACKTDWLRSGRNPLRTRAELVERLGGPTVVRDRLHARYQHLRQRRPKALDEYRPGEVRQ